MRLPCVWQCRADFNDGPQARGIALVVRGSAPARVVPAVAAVATVATLESVHVTDDVTPYARRHDEAVAAALRGAGADLRAIGGPWRVAPTDLGGSSGNGYLVFTPYFHAWDAIPVAGRIASPGQMDGPALHSDGLGALPEGDPPIEAGPVAAHSRLEAFISMTHTSGQSMSTKPPA